MSEIAGSDCKGRTFIVPVCFAIVTIIALLSLAGLALDNSLVAGFGIISQPVQLESAIGYVAIAGALLALDVRRPAASKGFLAVPLLIIFLSISHSVTGDGAFDDWISSSGISDRLHFFREPTCAETLATLAMLTVAVIMLGQRGQRFNPVSATLASITLGVSLVSAVVVGLGATSPAAHSFFPSLPAAAQATALSATILWWGKWPGWETIPGRELQQSRIVRGTFPIIVLVPGLSALLEIGVDRAGWMSPLVLDVIIAGVNIAIFTALLFWSIARIAAEHAALSETAHAMESAPIALTSPDGSILHWTRGCEELYGWTAEQVLGRPKYEAVDSREASPPHAAPRSDDARQRQRELIERRRDGTQVHVIERVRVVTIEGRAPVVVHKLTDISERVRMEAALTESEANLSLALNTQQVGTFEWDVATGKVAVSAGMEQRLGLRPGDLGTFSGWTQRIDPDDMSEVMATIEAAASRDAEHYNFQYRITVPNGGVRSIEGNGRLIYDTEGRLARVVGVHVDVTDRNEREATLLAQREQLRLVLATVPSAMVIFDELEVIQAFSASAERMFGFTAEEVIGRKVEMLAASPEIHRANSFIERYLAGGTSRVNDETPVTYARRRDGSFVPLELWMGDMRVGSRRLFTAFARELTERLASERRLASMRDELLHASRLSTMGEMAAGLAHELNQPLAAASYFFGTVDLLLDQNTNCEEGRSLLRLGVEQVLRAGDIIRRMRDFATRETVDMQIGQISGIIDDAVALAFLGEARYDIKLTYQLDPAAGTVLADRVQIVQVLVNLLRNATEELRKCPISRRSITITTAALDAEFIEVSVADSGPGLDPRILDRLYMPFESTKPQKGMGVGLSICRRIIDAHGGTLTAAKNPSGGAVFRFTLSNALSPETDA